MSLDMERSAREVFEGDLNEWFQHVCCTQENDKFNVKQDKQGKMETADICMGNNLF